MHTKNLSFSFSSYYIWGLVAALSVGGALLNAWLGFPMPVPFDGYYSSFGGIIPYSDAGGYYGGSYEFNNLGYLNSWNMRRPINALFLAFRQNITDGNFWQTMVIQASMCAIALMLYLRTIHRDLGLRAACASLFFFLYYAQSYIPSTLSETLGLTLGAFSFILLWNGFLNNNRFMFNVGVTSLTIALSARAGPNFMILALFLLVYLTPFSSSRITDLSWSIASFAIPFLCMAMLSKIFGDPESSGETLSNFSYTLYGLVNGGKTWLYAYQEPSIAALLEGKTEAQQAHILYMQSWEAFKHNPINICIGMTKYLGGFFYWFIKQLSFGTGVIKALTTFISICFWGFIGYKIYTQRLSFKKAYLFLTIIFLGIAASSCITWKDGGIRTFATAIPFIGALLGFGFAKMPLSYIKQFMADNICAMCFVCFIILSSTITPFIPFLKKNVPDISSLQLIPPKEDKLILTYKPAKQPYLVLDSTPGLHFATLSSNQIENRRKIYEDSSFGKFLNNIALRFNNNNNVLCLIYDYISKSQKLIIAEKEILNIKSQWLVINANFIDIDDKTFYKANSYKELIQ